MLLINYSRPSRVIKILSAMNKVLTSRFAGLCQTILLMFLWAYEKFLSTFEEVIMQKTVRSSTIWELSCLARILVLGSGIFYWSMIFIFPYTSLALKREQRAFNFIFELRVKEYTIGLAPWALPPFFKWGALLSPILACPVFFCGLIFLPEPAVMALFLVILVLNQFKWVL